MKAVIVVVIHLGANNAVFIVSFRLFRLQIAPPHLLLLVLLLVLENPTRTRNPVIGEEEYEEEYEYECEGGGGGRHLVE